MWMKNVLFFLILSALNSNAQNWAEYGAVWHYDFWNLTSQGYVKIEKMNDTIINNKVCDVLYKTRNTFDYISNSFSSISLGKEYTYLDSNKVYNYRYNSFYILYDFNAIPGDTWEVAGNYLTCDSSGIIRVDSVGTTVINSTTLRYLYTSIYDGYWKFAGKIIEKIGCIGYMFPEQGCAMDIHEGGDLRCYRDSSTWFYQTNISPYCNYIVDVTERLEDKSIGIFSNPINSLIFVSFPEKLLEKIIGVKIIDIYGKEIISADKYLINNNTFSINILSLPSGCYCFQLIFEDCVINKKILKP